MHSYIYWIILYTCFSVDSTCKWFCSSPSNGFYQSFLVSKISLIQSAILSCAKLIYWAAWLQTKKIYIVLFLFLLDNNEDGELRCVKPNFSKSSIIECQSQHTFYSERNGGGDRQLFPSSNSNFFKLPTRAHCSVRPSILTVLASRTQLISACTWPKRGHRLWTTSPSMVN